jgi:cation transport ATPase
MVTRITDIKAMIQNEIQWQRKKESERRVQKIHHKHKHTHTHTGLLLHQTVAVVVVVHWILFHVITHPGRWMLSLALALSASAGFAWPKSVRRRLFVRRGNMTRKRKNSPHTRVHPVVARNLTTLQSQFAAEKPVYHFINFRISIFSL